MNRSELISLLHASAGALDALDKSGAVDDPKVATAVGQTQEHLLDVILHLHQAITTQQGTASATTKKPCQCGKASAVAIGTEAVVEAEAVRPLVTSDSVTYGYDTLGRLTTLTYANGTVIQYNYDAVGNRTSVVTTCGSSGC